MSATGPSPNSPGWFLELVPNLPLAAIERRVRAGEQENPNYVSIAGTISALDRVVRTHGSGSPPVQWQPAARELVDHVEGVPRGLYAAPRRSGGSAGARARDADGAVQGGAGEDEEAPVEEGAEEAEESCRCRRACVGKGGGREAGRWAGARVGWMENCEE